jgi:hypothetical protein
MSLAVRVEKAFPLDDKKAPVPALEIAAKVAGTATPSSPALFGLKELPMTVSVRALVI